MHRFASCCHRRDRHSHRARRSRFGLRRLVILTISGGIVRHGSATDVTPVGFAICGTSLYAAVSWYTNRMRNSGFLVVLSTEPRVADRIVSSIRQRRRPVVSLDQAATVERIIGGAKIAAVIVCVERAGDWLECDTVVRTAKQHQLPVVALTRWASLDGRFRRRAFDLGCAAFVREPCDTDVLVAVSDRVTAGERHIEVIAS